jgi:ATP-dependent helicase/nuclease subunit B
VTELGLPARELLWSLVRRAKVLDLLAPVTVAVPSPYAGLALRRDLARRDGLVNVRFVALARVAELIGAPALAAAGRVPLSAVRRVEAVHAVLRAESGPFAAVADHRGTEQALAATFAALRRAAPDARDVLAARGGHAAAVVTLYERYVEATQDGYDEEDLARAAADAVAGGAALDEVGTVIAFLPRRRSPAEERLLAALAARDRGLVVEAAPLRDVLPEPAPRLVGAADPEDETRAALRRVLDHAEQGVPFGRMALLYPVAEPYARLVPELLEGASVPWNGPSPARLGDAVVGRVLTGVLDLADGGFPRDGVAAWLTAGPVLDADGRRVPGARWDLLSRTAGVVAGQRQWLERLTHRADELEADLTAARADDDEPEWRVARLERDLEHTRRLHVFIEELARVATPPPATTWAGFGAWARQLLARYLGSEGHRHDWPERDLDAGRRVDAVLTELASLDAVGGTVDLPRFRAALASALEAPGPHVGGFGRGVFVGPLHAAFGADFEVVTILGGTEGALPSHGREDPFLTDADRAAAGLPTSADRRAEGRRDYCAALTGAGAVTVSFHRADPRAQQPRLPARWLLDAAASHLGRPVSAEWLRAVDAPQPWLEVVASFEEGVVHDHDAGSIAERDLRALVEWRDTGRAVAEHPLALDALARGYQLAAARASSGFTEYDGRCEARPDGDDERAVSATALQDWATCPFRFLLGRVLRVREVPRPEAVETIHPLDEGLLVHGILETFVRERPPSTPEAAWTRDDLDRMLGLVDRYCRDAEARGVTGRPLLWRFARRRIHQSALRFLLIDTAVRRAHGAAPRAEDLEVAFGEAGQPTVVVQLGGSRTVRFRGRIDRVDRSPDGARVVVYDYKTGDPRHGPSLGDDPVVAGQRLQLPVYAHAALTLTGATEAAAYYWYTRDDAPPDEQDGFTLDARVQERFVDAVGHIVDGVDAGWFPAVPGDRDYNPRVHQETFANCFSCPYDRLCPADRATAWERKLDDPALDGYRALTDAE